MKQHSLKIEQKKHIIKNTVISIAIMVIGSVLCNKLYELDIEEQNISIVMMLTIFIIAAATDGYLYGLAATIIGVLIHDYLITAPRFGFSCTLGYPITLIIMLAVTLVTSGITGWLRRSMKKANKKKRYVEMLYEVNRKLLSCRDEDSIIRYACEYIRNELKCSVAYFVLPGYYKEKKLYFEHIPGGDTREFFDDTYKWERAELAGAEQQAVQDDVYYRPVKIAEEVHGVFGVRGICGADFPASLFDLIVEQASQALQIQTLNDKQQAIKLAAETEKVRNSFLRGISHDLRTPLTSMIGASSTLIENGEGLSTTTQTRLIEDIFSDAQWLLRMVENVLSLTRINQNDVKITKSEEVAEEIVGEAVKLFRKRWTSTDITIEPAENMIFVLMDPLLICQVIQNLLDNAQRHSIQADLKITIKIYEKDGAACFLISDNGKGIDPMILPLLFKQKSFPPEPLADSSRGMGVGLSLCKTIIEAHGGQISAWNKPEGGAVVMFTLPLEERNKI